MKFLALVAAATTAVVSAQDCVASTCASDNPFPCNALIVQLDTTCEALESDYACDCSGCLCGAQADGEITDAPDSPRATLEGNPNDGADGDNTVPLPPVFATGGNGGNNNDNPPATVDDDTEFTVAEGGGTPPPVNEGNGNQGTVIDGEATVITFATEPYRTSTTKTTATPFTGSTAPTEVTTTVFESTSWSRHTYDCEGSCADASSQGDGFCDDDNNVCNCDWDGGDCCGTDNLYIYCDHCVCHDPAFQDIYCGRTGCEDVEWYGDGFCDDGNNICNCDWDGGDCCGDQNNFNFCDDCKCVDPTHESSEASCNGNCVQSNYVGDGFCDDENNNCGCDWDNGDCCGNTNSYAHCDDCFCLDPDDANSLSPDHPITLCTVQCASQGWKGDGFCDDANNFCGCDWDGGDCCGGQNTYSYCDDCACIDPLFADFYPPNCPNTGECEHVDWEGDAFCDDANNICNCNWDGGDCCGTDNYYTYCDSCECLDPGFIAGECVGSCMVKGYQGDGYCDDGNNNCGCDWDGGDCCDANAIMTHCDLCQCLDPEPLTACSTSCEVDGWQGDGYCDDGNNVCGCDWDGGDCCGSNGISTQYFWCQECECKNGTSTGTEMPGVSCTGVCDHTDWKSDTHCDDGNNNCGCDWDGGDCCGDAISTAYCTECQCLDPDSSSYVPCNGECAHPLWAGDSYCDDGNNLCGCDWDNGDCCGDDNVYNQCTDCSCKDPNAVVDTATDEDLEVILPGGDVTQEAVTGGVPTAADDGAGVGGPAGGLTAPSDNPNIN